MGEHQPTVECRRSTLAAAARPYSKVRSGSLDHISQSGLFIDDESGQLHTLRPVLALVGVLTLIGVGLSVDSCLHAIRVLALVVVNSS
jgi:hypothetical protein